MTLPPVSAADMAGMEHALALAQHAASLGEVPVGAVVMQGGMVLARAHNETVARRDPTAHAELLVVQRALEQVGQGRLDAATLYVTLEPCALCAGAIVLARLAQVRFGAWDPKAGMAGSVHDLLRHPGLNHQPDVRGGILADRCGTLLQEFFRARRP